MPDQVINYQGQTHTFPESFTQGDIAQALQSYKPMQPTKLNVGTQAEPRIVPALDTSKPFTVDGEVQEPEPTVHGNPLDQHEQHAANVDAAAYQGAESTFKLDSRYKLGNWGERDQWEDLVKHYAGAPVLASLAALSPLNAQRYARIAQNAAAVEHVIMGTDVAPGPEEVAYYRANNLPVPARTQQGLATVVLGKAVLNAQVKIQQVFSDIMDFTGQHPGPKSPAEVKAEGERKGNLAALKDVLQYEIPSINEHTRFAEFARGVADFGPTAVALSAAPWAAFPTLALDGYAALRLRGVDPGWAMAGGLVGGAVAMVPGEKFVSGLATRAAARTEAQVAVAQIARAYGSPTVANALREFGAETGKHAISGYLMMVGMGHAQEAAAAMDEHGKTGRVPDISKVMQRSAQIWKDSLAPAVFFGAIGGANKAWYAHQGRLLAAHSDNVVLNTISDLVQGSKDPAAMAEHLAAVVDKRRNLRMLETAAQTAEQQGSEMAPKWARAANEARGELRAWVTAPEFAAAAKRMGIEPEMLARRVLLNGSIGFKDAEIMKIPLAVPLEDFVVRMNGDPDGASLHPDVPAASVIKDEPKPPEFVPGPEVGTPESLAARRRAQDPNAQTQETAPVTPEQVAAPVRTALEREAREALENAPVGDLSAQIFRRATAQAKEDFRNSTTPEERRATSSAWARALAHEAARKEVAKEARKVQSALDGLDTEKNRAAAHAGDTGTYGKAWDALTGLRDGTGGGVQGLAEALSDLARKGETYDEETTQAAMRGLAKSGATDASLNEIKAVHDLLTALRANAAASGLTLVDGQMRGRENVIATDMTPAVKAGVGDTKPPGTYDGLQRYWQKWLEATFKDPEKMTQHALLQPFGNWGRDRSYWYIKARRAEDVLWTKQKDLLKIPKDLVDLGQQPIEWPAGMRADMSAHPKPTRWDAWGVLLRMGNVEDAARFANSWGMNEAQIEDWLHNDIKLTKPELDHVQKTWDTLRDLQSLVDGARALRNSAPLRTKTPRTITTPHGEYTGGSAPHSYLEDKGAVPINPSGPSVTVAEGKTYSTFQAPKPEALVLDLLQNKTPDPYWRNLLPIVKDIVHDLSFGDWNRDTYRMLTDPRFKTLTVSSLGQKWYDRLTGWYNVVAEGRLSRDADAGFWTNMLYGTRHMAAQAVFNLNVPVVAGQIAHLPTMMARFGITPLEMRAGIGKALSTSGQAFADQHSQVVPFRDRDYNEKHLDQMAQISRDPRRKLYDLGAVPGLALQHGMDRFLTQTLWHSFYQREVNRGRSHEEAVKEADLRVDQSMPAVSIMDQSAQMRDRIYGAFFLVRNFPQTVWNLKAMDSWDTHARESGGAGALSWQGHGGLIARRLGMYGGLGLGMYLMGHGRTEQEQKDGWAGGLHFAIRELTLEGSYGSPLLHELMRFGSSFFDGGSFSASNAKLFETPVAQFYGALARDLGKLRHGDGGEKAFAALDAAGRALGVLAPSMVRSAKGAYQIVKPSVERWQYGDHRLLMAEDFPGVAKSASLLYYGPRKESNPLLDTDELYHKIFGGVR